MLNGIGFAENMIAGNGRPNETTTVAIGQHPPLNAMNFSPLNTTDRQEIMDLISRYSYTYDEAKNPDAWVSLFIENATWSIYEPNSSVPVMLTKSNEERRQEIEQRLKMMATLGIQTRQFMANTLLNKTSEGKEEGITMFLVAWQNTSEAGLRLMHPGYYRDTFAKTEQGWKFALREAYVDQTSG